MNLFPAIKASMGSWTYFMVKMSMRDLSENVQFATDVYDDHTLSDAIQRVLNESRARTSIAEYLVRQDDRFFSSIVVAALGGEPRWYPVTMEADDRFALVRDDSKFRDSFGVLSFNGDQRYYALDGQHRLKAIKSLVDPTSDMARHAPQNFRNEEVSVLVVVPKQAEEMRDFLRKYRRLFGNLNRYAKPMDSVTNIIMDEDDAFAIITRDLISQHEFFQWTGRERSSARIKTEGGKNLRRTDSYFTSLETLYDMNIRLLSSMRRCGQGWDLQGNGHDDFRRFRPEDQIIENLFSELKLYWDAIIRVLPVLRNKPVDMRDHNATPDSNTQDCVFFWPIGQLLLADLVRSLLDRQAEPDRPSIESVEKALLPLKDIKYDFKDVPYRHLVLIPDDDSWANWKIRTEDRKKVMMVAERILAWQIGLDTLSNEEITELRSDWQKLLLPAMNPDQVGSLWQKIVDGVVR